MSAGSTVKVPQARPSQPLASVIVTQNSPDLSTLIVGVVAPLLQAYWKGGVPLAAAARSVPDSPQHTVVSGTEIWSSACTVSVPQACPWQPWASVTVTQYSPAWLTEMDGVV